MYNRPLNVAEYQTIKDEQSAGGSVAGTAKRQKRSWDVVNKVFRSRDFTEYKTFRSKATPLNSILKPAVTSETKELPLVAQLRIEQARIHAQFEDVISTIVKLGK